MKIESLKLTNFRNYFDLNLQFDDKMNIFIGDNGAGKTNILESIYILSLTKSNRYGVEENLINFKEEFSKISGMIKSNDLLRKLEIVLTKNTKQLYINDKEIRRSRDYISKFCIIAFTPSDLEIIKGSPNVRRNMMNIDISQLQNDYISYLNEYNSIIKIRNEYLKRMNINGNTDERYLDIVNNNLVAKASKIYQYRFAFLEKINNYLPKIFKQISGIEGLQLCFVNNLHIFKYDDEIQKKMLNKLKRNFKMELIQGMTVIGPHRDDFYFSLNGTDMREFSSQGQQRIAVISLKIAEIYLFKEELGEYPVLLLDDIFSEIDSKKRNKIIKYLNGEIQSIITTTDINDIDKDLLVNAAVYNVKNNKVTRKGKIKNGRRKSNN